jgi:SAM-dependent methyltransferase
LGGKWFRLAGTFPILEHQTMNRKQRRAPGRSGIAASGVAAAGIPDNLATVFAAAVRAHHSGALAEAEHQYRHILMFDPRHAEAQGRLGAVLMAQGKTSEAITQLERATALDPDLFEAFGNLAQAYLATGQDVKAVQAAYRALELRETPLGKALFARCARNAVFRSDKDSRARRLMLRALLENWAPPRTLTRAFLSLIKLGGGINDCIARANTAWPTRLPATELLDVPGMVELLGDQLLRGLLEREPITEIGLERLLTNVRSAMLTLCRTSTGELNESLLEFFCAVARQCFLNEYIYPLTEGEAAQATELKVALGDKINAGDPVPAHWIMTVGAYFPLHAVSNAWSLRNQSWPQCVEALILQQITEPAEEHQIAAVLPALTAINDEVSEAVRQQYEENPYPRWFITVAPEKTPGRDDRRGPVPDILIAGCGTGLSLVEISRASVAARVLAIDLSRASLSYAKRMAQKLGLDNVEFAQADVLQLGSVGREFDFIDASGILHHLVDPWHGWRVLLSLLRSGGTMNIGLYSDLARRNVAAARDLIAQRGYRPIPQDISLCRQDIIASDDGLLKSLTGSQDFYTTSECRDLLFHVQELRITLPQIKAFLAANDLHFAGFNLEPAILQKFSMRFPGRGLGDLDCWHTFETEAPETFRGMYQFQVRKSAPRF